MLVYDSNQSAFVRVGSLLEWTINIETDPREVTTKDGSGWREYTGKSLKEFSGSANGLTIDIANDRGRELLVGALMNNNTVRAKFLVENADGMPNFDGNVIITSREISSPEEDTVASDLSFQGSEALTLGRELIYLEDADVPSDQNDVLVADFTPGYAFQITKVEHWVDSINATAEYDLEIGGVSALAAHETPTAGTWEEATLSGTASDLEGTDQEALNLRVTTDSTGSMTNLRVRITIEAI